MSRRNYNLTSLETICKEKNINFLKIIITKDKVDCENNVSENNISGTTYIKGDCTTYECRGKFCRYFAEIYRYGGKCKKCIITNKYNLITLKNLNLQLNRKYYNDELHAHFVIDGKCLKCTNFFSRKFCELLKIGAYCDVCALKNGNNKKINTYKERYGVENISKLKTIKKKKEDTCIKNHGVPYATQSSIIQKQIVETSEKNWGTKRPTQNKKLLEKMADNYENKTGFRNPFLNPHVKSKIEKTNIQNLGCSNPFSNDNVKDKIKNTNISKYGYSNPMKNPTILKKMFKTGCKLKPYILPSGKITEYMGYENYALDELLLIYEENDIKNENLPVFDYIKHDGTMHTYLPDIFVISQNKFVEVKSTYTIKCDVDVIFIKQNAVKNAGYKCEIWVYNSKGEKVECYE
jgi:hypothetical protein